jgi:excisionase family DNA binding protein
MPDNQRPNQNVVRLMNIRDAARYLGTTPATLYTKIWRREIPFVKLGRSVRFDLKDLDALIEGSKVKPDALNNCRRLQ